MDDKSIWEKLEDLKDPSSGANYAVWLFATGCVFGMWVWTWFLSFIGVLAL